MPSYLAPDDADGTQRGREQLAVGGLAAWAVQEISRAEAQIKICSDVSRYGAAKWHGGGYWATKDGICVITQLAPFAESFAYI